MAGAPQEYLVQEAWVPDTEGRSQAALHPCLPACQVWIRTKLQGCLLTGTVLKVSEAPNKPFL